MKHSSEKPLAPANYSRCFNNQCPKADNCLHRLAALRDTPEYPSIRIINPLCIPEDSSQCAYFQSTQKIHVAWGISHLLDEVPYKNLQPLKSQLIAHFGRGKYPPEIQCGWTYKTPPRCKKLFSYHTTPGAPAYRATASQIFPKILLFICPGCGTIAKNTQRRRGIWGCCSAWSW